MALYSRGDKLYKFTKGKGRGKTKKIQIYKVHTVFYECIRIDYGDVVLISHDQIDLQYKLTFIGNLKNL